MTTRSASGRVRALLLGSVAAAVLFELLLRQIHYVPKVFDPQRGIDVIAPGYASDRVEGSGRSHWLEHGVRRQGPVPSDGKRLLTIGDSYTEGLMIDDNEVYSDLVEHDLNHPNDLWAVVNVGVGGNSLADHVAQAARLRELFRPTWTIVQIRDDDLEADAWSVKPDGFARFARGADGALITVTPPYVPPGRLVQLLRGRFRSALLAFAFQRIRILAGAQHEEPPLFHAGAHRRPAAAAERSDWPVEEELDQLARAYAGRYTILYLPAFDARRLDRESPTETRLRNWCQAHFASCVSLRGSFESFAAAGRSPYGFAGTAYNEGHMNAAGHRAAATAVAAEVQRLESHGLL